MSLGNTNTRFGSVTRTFHWLTALLILAIIPIGLIANDLADAIRDPSIPSTPEDFNRVFLLFSLHKTLGVTIFFVALARILWALSQPRPALLNSGNRLESFMAQTVHWLLYGSLVLVPLAGWIDHAATTGYAPIRWPFGQSLPFVPKDADLAATFAGLHVVLQRLMVVALVLHILGALKHHFIDRDATLRRMLSGAPDPAPLPARQGGLWAGLSPPLAALAIWGAAIVAGFGLGVIPPYGGAPAPEPVAAASKWQVEDGSITLTITQLGNTVTGEFGDWTADITFDDPAAPGPAGRVDVTIRVASLSLGTLTDQAMGPDFLDADFFPEASFSAELIRTASGYEATGPLVIRDTSLPITLPFDLTLEGDSARMSAEFSLSRLDFGIGETVPDDTTFGLAVKISVNLTAKRAP